MTQKKSSSPRRGKKKQQADQQLEHDGKVVMKLEVMDADIMSIPPDDKAFNEALSMVLQYGNYRHEYTPVQRIQAAMAYLDSGSYNAASRRMLIPVATIHRWSKEPWWGVALQSCMVAKNKELEGSLSRIALKTVKELEDRALNGQKVLDRIVTKAPKAKKGEKQESNKVEFVERREPLKAETLLSILNTVVDKRKLVSDANKQILAEAEGTGEEEQQNITSNIEDAIMKAMGKVQPLAGVTNAHLTVDDEDNEE